MPRTAARRVDDTSATVAPAEPPSQPAASSAALPATDNVVAIAITRDVPLGALMPSPLNPRREIDKTALRELADSIHENGLLQALLVRESPQMEIGFKLDGKSITPYELICGERRLRAMALNVDLGRASWADPVPCRVRACSDTELLVLAGTENLQRKDMHPLDEAHYFDALRKALNAEGIKGRAEEEVARKLGVGARTVFRRLKSLRLAPEIQTAWRAGDINQQQAEAFALGEHNEQRAHLKRMKRESWRAGADRIKSAMVEGRIPAKVALFDLDLYDGERLTDDDETVVYLTDIAQFTRLQRVALDAKKAELEKKSAFVAEIAMNADHDYLYCPGGRTGVLISVSKNLARVQIQSGYLTKEMAREREQAKRQRDKSSSPKAGPAAAEPKRPLTKSQSVAIKHAKTLAMRRGLAKRPEVALAAAITSVLIQEQEHGGTSGEIRLRIGRDMNFRPLDDPGGRDEDEARQVRLLEPIADVLFVANKEAARDHEYSADTEVAIFRALCALPIGQLLALFAEFMGAAIGTWPGYQEEPHDTPMAIAIAAAVDAESELPGTWSPDEVYFAAYNGGALHALAIGAALAGDGFNKLKKTERVSLLSSQAEGFWAPWRFPELRFQDEGTLRKAMAAPYPVVQGQTMTRAAAATAEAAKGAKVKSPAKKPAAKKRSGK